MTHFLNNKIKTFSFVMALLCLNTHNFLAPGELGKSFTFLNNKKASQPFAFAHFLEADSREDKLFDEVVLPKIRAILRGITYKGGKRVYRSKKVDFDMGRREMDQPFFGDIWFDPIPQDENYRYCVKFMGDINEKDPEKYNEYCQKIINDTKKQHYDNFENFQNEGDPKKRELRDKRMLMLLNWIFLNKPFVSNDVRP